jgi:hypothetical protein
MKRFHKNIVTTAVFLLVGFLFHAYAQITISGRVSDGKKHAVSNASILIKETNAGVTADSAGRFRLSVPDSGKKTLEISALGFETKTIFVNGKDSIMDLDILLREEHQMLGEVVVSAGSFEASDKAKGASLTPMDAVTVAGNGGDLANAMRALPGAQRIGEREGLFVRGGTSEETKQFVDGALFPNPNFASVPGLPQPAHLNPFLFSGILFSSGGYSALYGDALSSALILQTVDLPDKSSASLHLFPTSQGAGFQELTKNRKSSYGIELSYGNQHVYNQLVPQRPDFFQGPEYFTGNANFRIRTGKTGLLKFYMNYGYSKVGMRNPDIDSSDLISTFQTKGMSGYANLSYRAPFGDHWKIDAVVASDDNNQKIVTQSLDKDQQLVFIADTPYNAKNSVSEIHSRMEQARVVLTRSFSRSQAIRFGAEYFLNQDDDQYNGIGYALIDNRIAAFAEADIYLTRHMAIKTGLRYESSSLLRQSSFSPRVSLAYRFYGGSQINLAYGVFYEKPEPLYLTPHADPAFTKAVHYIVNYQRKANNRLFRIEAYYKSYSHLVTTYPFTADLGKGYARGIEFFFRDKKTVKDLDYWITYTYLDTRRQYLNYPGELRPDFAAPHTVSIAVKRFFPDLHFSANASYSLASGRPYYDIRMDGGRPPMIYDQGTTRMYNTLNLSFAYLFRMFKAWKHKDFSGIGFGINNVLGTKQVFGYNYSYNGLNKLPVTLPATRSYYIGLFMSFGTDRTNDFIDQNL